MTSSGERTSSLTPACIAGAARVTLKALSSREIARLLVRLAPGLPAYRRRETRQSGERLKKLGAANCVVGVSRAARALAPEGGVVSLRRIAPPTLSGARISPGHFSIRPDSLCRQLRKHGFRHQLEEPISLVG